MTGVGYTGFGKVIEGLDELDRIAAVDVDSSDKPKEEQKITSMTVELFDYESKEPEKA